ncbi:hypothetical protein FO519_007720 [Halicephalobus sp. NKZ332]|nr:hypothetical protein FO519_007720 [Halicephalobus sp. NKZ332]
MDSLPKKRIKNNDDTIGEALKAAKSLGLSSVRRAIPIPIHTDLHSADNPSTSSSVSTCSSSISVSFSTLFCVPMTDYDLKGSSILKNFEFMNLSNLVNEALNMTEKMEVETIHFVERIENWLSSQQQRSVDFLERLFCLKTVEKRFRSCVHNPAANPGFGEFCLLLKLDDQGKKLPDYFAKGRNGFSRHKRFEDQKSPTEVWEIQFPLHKAAMDDDHERTQALLDQGYDPNAFDNDSWTPLHYCAFYGKLKVAQVLMNHATTSVNLTNKKGETPLHFAAMNGFHHLIELILSNAKIDKDIKNNRGLTPLDMCKQFPKAPWTHCAIILSRSKTIFQAKNLEVHCGEKELLHMHCDGSTTADDLMNDIFTELKFGPECSKLFAIWIVGSRLELQLKGDQKVQKQLEKYPKYLESWGEALSFGRPGVVPNDIPSVSFKRKAMARVKDDRELVGFL